MAIEKKIAAKRNTSKAKPSKKHANSISESKSEEAEMTSVSGPLDPWTPSPGTAFKLLMSTRLCAALWSSVSDCDETYNYWEPAHFLKYGKGFQTWEYSPEYALRSYAYILLHVMPMKLFTTVLGDNSILVFYITRCLLGIACASSEVLLYRGVTKLYGPNIARLFLVLLLFSAGMFISSTAFLPSSFSMYLTMLAYGSWFLGKASIAIMCIAVSAIWGWPFAAALGIPIAFEMVILRKKFVYFFKWCAISAVLFLIPLVVVDMHLYGKLVVAPLNIILYNVISGHGPELYGVEPLSYYIINGFLNFNFAFVLALLSLPFLLICSVVFKWPSQRQRLLLTLAPMYIWIVIFFTRPHKEERFLFPIYPFFALATSLTLDTAQRILYGVFSKDSKRSHYADSMGWFSAAFCFLYASLCLSRIVALYQGYHAPMDVYVELHRVASDPKIHTLAANKPVNVCVGKEWYRFPSSFFLPGPNWHLQFLQSEFKGQLPKLYEQGPDATRLIPSHMNDMNREEASRYVDISRCHYLIDRDSEDWTVQEPNYSASKDWTVIKQVPFLDASRSHRLFRAFYVPFFSSQHCTYVSYSLLKTTRTKKHSKQSKKS
ncbi:mannosyltransferase [Plakobranchus ocellatus]|uniref:Mannosyltransferase n=1 Tax=Plakobranchus ocellatus TaxID=259542 RepID=A0AAV3ZUP6_9GAST|nr:mannosyltransferase [Plakobranchus ocellatus]